MSLLPGALVALDDLDTVLTANQLFVPAIAIVATYFYVALNLRGAQWNKENDKYVSQQIRVAIMQMLPSDLQVSDAEKERLADKEVLRTLTGVFWEAISRDEDLSSHKEHFYSNGIVYTTAFDVYLICSFVGLCYLTIFAFNANVGLLLSGINLVTIAIMSRALVVPRVRQQHMSLSREQLDLLQRNQREFVSKRFREIITEWRQSSNTGP